MDKIILSMKDMQNLIIWKDNNKDLVRNAKPVLHQGIIDLGDKFKIKFKYNKLSIHYDLILDNQTSLYFDDNRPHTRDFSHELGLK